MGGSPQIDRDLDGSLVAAKYDLLRRYVFMFLPDEKDAIDVFQEMRMSISRRFDEHQRSRPFLPWIRPFAVTACSL